MQCGKYPCSGIFTYLVQQITWTSWAKSQSHNSDCILIYSHFLNRVLPPVIWHSSYKKIKGLSNVLQKSYSIRNINSNPYSLFTLSSAIHTLDNFLKSYNMASIRGKDNLHIAILSTTKLCFCFVPFPTFTWVFCSPNH